MNRIADSLASGLYDPATGHPLMEAPKAGLRFLFIDFNAYFASVEQHDNPAYRGKPLIVTPLESEHSGAIAASYEAKPFGIKRGTSVKEARQLCPSIIVCHARHDRYVDMHKLLMAEIENHLPIHHIYSIDECACILSRDEQDEASARAKALEIKQAIYSKIGSSLRCSIGLAPSSLLAKLASDFQKPDGLSVIHLDSLPQSLAALPLRDIPGIGPNMEWRLAQAGIRDFPALWSLAPKQARAIWRSVAGERFIYALKGHDVAIRPEPTEKRMLGHSRVLSGEHRQPDKARIVARALLLKAASRLRIYKLYAGGLSIGIRLYPEGRFMQELHFRPTQNSWRFLRELEQCWPILMRQAQQHNRRTSSARPSLKMVTLYLYRLDEKPPEADLFHAMEQDDKDQREARLWDAMDRLNRLYSIQGKAPKIALASQKGLGLNYLGVKIAFSRVPDAEEFLC